MRDKEGQNCLRPRCCWIRAGQLRLQLVWGTRRAGLAGSILKDAWLQMHSAPQSGSLFSQTCAGSKKKKKKSRFLVAPGAAVENLPGGPWPKCRCGGRWGGEGRVEGGGTHICITTRGPPPSCPCPPLDKQIDTQL